jgi:hypothetical protein
MNILTVKQTAQKYPAFSEAALRRDIFNSDTNGLSASGALIRKGRRVLFVEDKFVDWLVSGAAGECKK